MSVNFFTFWFVSFLTRGLQKFKNKNFACCVAQTNFTEEANSENLVRLFKFQKFSNICTQSEFFEKMLEQRSNTSFL